MKEFLKVTRQRVKNHMQYGKWYYIVGIIAAIIVVNLAYTLTNPRYPKENTISVMMYAGIGEEDVLDTWEDDMLKLISDDQRQVNVMSTVPVDVSTQTVIIARIAANEDDMMVTDIEDMQSYANGGAFLPLDEHMDLSTIYEMYPDVDWAQYAFKSEALEDKEEHVYWLPLYMVEGFEETGLITENLGIGILGNSVNVDNAVICLEYILTR